MRYGDRELRGHATPSVPQRGQYALPSNSGSRTNALFMGIFPVLVTGTCRRREPNVPRNRESEDLKVDMSIVNHVDHIECSTPGNGVG